MSWHDVAEWIVSGWSGATTTTVRIVGLVLCACVAQFMLTRLIKAFRLRIAERLTTPEQVKRAATLGRVFRYLVTVAISLIAGMLVLSEVGVSVAPILGAAGVVGLAIGFGAQSLVRDYFTGFFLLLENQITTGDVVSVADRAGVVEDVTLRYVRLRDYDGNVHFVPNGTITSVTNMSQGFAYAVVDAGVAYREDVDVVLSEMRSVAEQLHADPAFSGRLLEPVEMVGVERWDESAVVLRCRFKVRPLEQWNVRREYLRRLKRAFDQRGIEIPYPHLTIYAGADALGRAPPFQVVRGRR